MDWRVYLYVHDIPGTEYVIPFGVPGGEYGADSPEAAIDWVLAKYIAPTHGQRRFEAGWRVRKAEAVSRDSIVEADLVPIDQPEYQRRLPVPQTQLSQQLSDYEDATRPTS